MDHAPHVGKSTATVGEQGSMSLPVPGCSAWEELMAVLLLNFEREGAGKKRHDPPNSKTGDRG